jgi:hypothetical protein
VGQIYHQIEGDQPTSLQIQYGRMLKSDEQPYGPRRMKLAADRWTPLDLGWLSDKAVGLIVVGHEAALPAGERQTQPTPEARQVSTDRTVIIALSPPEEERGKRSMLDPKQEEPSPIPILFLGRGETVAFRPCPLTRWVMKCNEGEARVMITAYPD